MSFISSNTRRVAIAVGLSAVAATAGTSLLANAGPTETGGAALTSSVAQARAAATAPGLARDSVEGGKLLTSTSALRNEGQRALGKISLPPGHTLTVNWKAGEDQGGDNAYGVEQTVNFNAACHWVRYYVDHQTDPKAAEGLAAIADWPAIRGFAGGAAHFSAIASAAQSGDVGPAETELARNCPGM